MTAQEFLHWMEAVGARFAADIVERIGVNRNTAQEWLALAKDGRDVSIKRSIALAMSASAAGLSPWGEAEKEGEGS
ncbi:hypothetical protein [Methylosinus sp. Sm6]|uniref:hypothetical protein n=1 Tax=Methylosinus sp. Sm6 TaxID=2866948 RepID=UPI001C99E68C|nr:hypothetical protein [Methylosinus sp. Sm6]MBY6239788.1 hypothetical protein [Methylosinus sp. Sm6]